MLTRTPHFLKDGGGWTDDRNFTFVQDPEASGIPRASHHGDTVAPHHQDIAVGMPETLIPVQACMVVGSLVGQDATPGREGAV